MKLTNLLTRPLISALISSVLLSAQTNNMATNATNATNVTIQQPGQTVQLEQRSTQLPPQDTLPLPLPPPLPIIPHIPANQSHMKRNLLIMSLVGAGAMVAVAVLKNRNEKPGSTSTQGTGLPGWSSVR